MDFLSQRYHIIEEDEDLIYFNAGIAVQKDRTRSVEYAEDYFEKYVGYEGTPISVELNRSRVAITEKYCNTLLDIGIGSGEFIKCSNMKVWGYDINPVGVEWLKSRNLYLNPYDESTDFIEGFTFWDSLEHFPDPQIVLPLIKGYAFISIPCVDDILKVKEWKHFRPDEHYYYFTQSGLADYMKQSGFRLLECNDTEIQAGRQDIFTFVFQRQS